MNIFLLDTITFIYVVYLFFVKSGRGGYQREDMPGGVGGRPIVPYMDVDASEVDYTYY